EARLKITAEEAQANISSTMHSPVGPWGANEGPTGRQRGAHGAPARGPGEVRDRPGGAPAMAKEGVFSSMMPVDTSTEGALVVCWFVGGGGLERWSRTEQARRRVQVWRTAQVNGARLMENAKTRTKLMLGVVDETPKNRLQRHTDWCWDMSEAEAAEVLCKMEPEDAGTMLLRLSAFKAGGIMSHIPLDKAAELVVMMKPKQAGKILSEMNARLAAPLIKCLMQDHGVDLMSRVTREMQFELNKEFEHLEVWQKMLEVRARSENKRRFLAARGLPSPAEQAKAAAGKEAQGKKEEAPQRPSLFGLGSLQDVLADLDDDGDGNIELSELFTLDKVPPSSPIDFMLECHILLTSIFSSYNSVLSKLERQLLLGCSLVFACVVSAQMAPLIADMPMGLAYALGLGLGLWVAILTYAFWYLIYYTFGSDEDRKRWDDCKMMTITQSNVPDLLPTNHPPGPREVADPEEMLKNNDKLRAQ
ncbi:hypothetical protein CYMTET_33821, partial [Cymbomonas tetramitiformis]